MDLSFPIGIKKQLIKNQSEDRSIQHWSWQNKHHTNNYKVIVYDINLLFDEQQTISDEIVVQAIDTDDENIETISTTSTTSWYHQTFLQLCETLVTKWKSLQIHIVVCQKLIHPYIKQLCITQDILPLERLSIRHISFFQQISCATVLSGTNLDLIQDSICGYIGQIEERIINKKK